MPHTPPGCKLHPRPRQWRILRNFNNKQLPAVAWIMQATASGQASKAGHAVRIAHSEKPLDRPENECIHFLAGHRFFLCPEALFATFKLQAQIVCSCFQAGLPGWVQGPSGPWRGFGRAERPTFPPCQFLFTEYHSESSMHPFSPALPYPAPVPILPSCAKRPSFGQIFLFLAYIHLLCIKQNFYSVFFQKPLDFSV